MSRQRYRLARYRAVAAVAAVAGLGLAASACSSSPASNAGGDVTVSINCAPTQAQDPVQHKEWIADVATFEKANPTITITSVYNYPCTNLPTFTAQLRAGTEPDVTDQQSPIRLPDSLLVPLAPFPSLAFISALPTPS